MAHFISESTVHEYQYSIEHFPETSSLMSSGSGTNYDFSIWSRSSHSSLSLKELWTSFPDATSDDAGRANFANFWPIDFKLSADSRQIGFDGMGLDVVAHVNNVEA